MSDPPEEYNTEETASPMGAEQLVNDTIGKAKGFSVTGLDLDYVIEGVLAGIPSLTVSRSIRGFWPIPPK